MATWNTPPTYAVGDSILVNDWNTIANNETFLYQKPYGIYWNSVATACGGGATTQVTLGSSTVAYGFAAASVNNAVIPVAGLYMVKFSVAMSSTTGSGSNAIWSYVWQNGTPVIKGGTVSSYSAGPTSPGSGLLRCNIGDRIGLYLGNSASASLSTSADPDSTFLELVFMGSQ